MTKEEAAQLALDVQNHVAGLPSAEGWQASTDWAYCEPELTAAWWEAVDVACGRTVDISADEVSYVCCLPNGHTGPCVGWDGAGLVHMKNRLSWSCGIAATLPARLWQEETT